MRDADYGWAAILGFAAVYNTAAAGRRRPLLSDSARRFCAEHPILGPVALGLLWLHLTGHLPRGADPLHWLGVAVEKIAELLPRPRRSRRA